MALTGAERQARLRAHKSGDHSLCDASRRDCDVTSQVPPPADMHPRGLGRRGKQLWQDVTAAGELAPTDRVLLEEACRTTDRLDRLDVFLRGESDRWLDLVPTEDGPVVVVIDKALSEARQQQVALKTVLAELRASRGSVPKQPAAPVPQPAPREAADVPAGTLDFAAALAAKGRRPAAG